MRTIVLAVLFASAAATVSAAELKDKVALSAGEAELKVKYPDDERKRWAETVLAAAKDGLPALEKAAGFACPVSSFTLEYAEEAGAADGFEARWKGDGKVAVRQKAARGGYHKHWVLTALAHAWAEKVATEPWLRESLAHFFVWQALAELPAIYDQRTYRDEIVQEAAKAAETPLDGWTPAPKADTNAGADNPTAWAEVARGMLMLCCVERQLGEGTIAKAAAAVSGTKAGGTKEFMEAVGVAAGGKPAEELFLGWAIPIPEDDDEKKPALETAGIKDGDDDSLLDFEEKALGTDPKKADTDGDGWNDGEEVFFEKTDPRTKDAVAPKVRLDGDGKEWMKLKKFSLQDGDKADAKGGVKGAELRKLNLCADKKYAYFLLEVDSFANAEVKYTIAFDNDQDETFDYYVGWRGDTQRWIGDAHGVKDLSWCEWKNHRGIMIRYKEAVPSVCELRVPLAAVGDPKKTTLLVYSGTAKEAVIDSLLRTTIEVDRWRH